MSHSHDYIPAAGHDHFLRFYDPLTRLLGAERVRERLLDHAAIQPGERVLDLGCGTGALSIAVKRRVPEAEVTGLDPDPKALALARSKDAEAGLGIEWVQGYAGRIPFPSDRFDCVVSSLVIHHLTADQKREAFRDARRVLRPGGRLRLLDFGPPRGWAERALTAVFHRDHRIGDNLAGRLPGWLREAGFAEVTELGSARTAFGRVTILGAE